MVNHAPLSKGYVMRKKVLIVALVLLVALVSCADHEHAWSEWKVVEESTCTKAGSRTRTCIGCNEKETEKLPLKEHSYEWKVIEGASCEKAGSMQFVCSVCEAKGETKEIPALGHKWDSGSVTKTATCKKTGEKTYTCENCKGTKTEEIPVDYDNGHNYGEDGKCTVCGQSKTLIETAEARIGSIYYAMFEKAVIAALNSDIDSEKIVEVLVKEISLGDHFPVNGSVTINANGADFKNKDLSVYHYKEYTAASGKKMDGDVVTKQGDIKIVINDANNLHLWGNVDNFREEGTVISIEMKNCKSEGDSRTASNGMLIYLTGNKGTTNVLLEGCSSTKSSSPVYTNASGEIVIKDCTFTECAVPVNMNYKATEGTRMITIDGCTFTACGCTEEESTGSNLSEYAAPIRVLHTADGSDDCVTITNTSITGTVGTNGDVLLLAKHEDDSKIKAEKAILENNKTDIKVVYGKDEANVKTVKAGTSDTIEVVLPLAST